MSARETQDAILALLMEQRERIGTIHERTHVAQLQRQAQLDLLDELILLASKIAGRKPPKRSKADDTPTT